MSKTEKLLVGMAILAVLVAFGLSRRRAWFERQAMRNDAPVRVPADVVIQPATIVQKLPMPIRQEPNESMLRLLPNGEYVLPAGRFLTEEDEVVLGMTPVVKIIHGGPPGTLEYHVATQYDPAAQARYNHQKRGQK